MDWSGGSGVADERQGFGGIRPKNSISAGAVNTLFGRYDIDMILFANGIALGGGRRAVPFLSGIPNSGTRNSRIGTERAIVE